MSNYPLLMPQLQRKRVIYSCLVSCPLCDTTLDPEMYCPRYLVDITRQEMMFCSSLFRSFNLLIQVDCSLHFISVQAFVFSALLILSPFWCICSCVSLMFLSLQLSSFRYHTLSALKANEAKVRFFLTVSVVQMKTRRERFSLEFTEHVLLEAILSSQLQVSSIVVSHAIFVKRRLEEKDNNKSRDINALDRKGENDTLFSWINRTVGHWED